MSKDLEETVKKQNKIKSKKTTHPLVGKSPEG